MNSLKHSYEGPGNGGWLLPSNAHVFGKAAWTEVDHLPATVAEANTVWICTSAPLYAFNGAVRDNHTVCHFHAVDGIQRNRGFLFRIAFLG